MCPLSYQGASGHADAYKRAGFRWGIGIELYSSPFIFLPVATESDGRGKYKMVNPRELYGIYVSDIQTEDGRIKALSLAQANKIIWSTDKRKVGMTI